MQPRRHIQVGDHAPEPVRRDLFAFEVDKVQWTLKEMRELSDQVRAIANHFQLALNKIEAAVEFNSISCLRQADLDLVEMVKAILKAGDLALQTEHLRGNLEIIVAKASRS